VPALAGSERRLGIYRLDEETSPLLDLDDPQVLAQRSIRPTHVAIRNRPRTQQIAGRIYQEGKWSGIQWWSYHRPQWTLVVIWEAATLPPAGVEPIAAQAALEDAALPLAKPREGI